MTDLEQLLAPYLAARVIAPLDLRFALTLARIAPEPPSPEVALGAAAASAALSRGNICLELGRAAALLAPREEDAPLAADLAWPAADTWRAGLMASPLVSDGRQPAPLVLVDDRLYLHRYFDYQRRLARALALRRNTLFPVHEAALATSLDRLFASAEPDPTQRQAAETAVRRGLTIISGGPGTGKTSTVVRILGALLEQDPELRATLVAPTGKAAARLASSIRDQREALDLAPHLKAKIPEDASTLHRRLGFQPKNRSRFAHDAAHPLTTDVVVLDEASMVDLALMTKLVEAVPQGARLILLGDKDQLASVEAGHVLGDIAEVASPGGPLVEAFVQLTHSHRFDPAGGIGRLARAIRDGDEAAVLEVLEARPPGVTWLEHDEDRLLELAVAGWAPLGRALGSPEAALAALPRFQVLCAHRRGPWGAEHLAAEIARGLARARHIPEHQEWYPGRPVIVLVNDHAQDLWNGDTGVALRGEDGLIRVSFPTYSTSRRASDGVTRAVSIAQLPSHASFYATTIHKSQGSGFDHVVAVLPPRPTPVVTRELLYTAVTRARAEVTLIASREVLLHAVRTRVARASGLGSALGLVAR